MWLYIPPMSCPSAPEGEDSTLESNWQGRILERCVTWNGKPSRSASWLRRWQSVASIKLLYGAMPEPSTADRGVESWIASLAAFRVSPGHTPEADSEPPMNVTCGRTPAESSVKSAPASSFWRKFQDSLGISTNGLGQTYEEWVTGLRRDYSRRQKSERPTSGVDSSSWLTPTADSSASDAGEWKGTYYLREDGTKANSALTHQAANWPTPVSSPGEYTYQHGDGENPAMKLEGAARAWRSPSAADAEGGVIEERPQQEMEKMRHFLLRDQASNWPTPVSSDGNKRGWGERSRPSSRLAYVAKSFPTPSARDHKGFDGPGKRNPSRPFAVYSLPNPPAPANGHTCSTKCRRLNPRFVEWLMGWPDLWSLLPYLDTGAPGFDYWETVLSHWWRLMRSALSRLGPHEEGKIAKARRNEE